MSTNVIRTFKIQGSGTKYTGGRYTTKNNSLASVARKAGARLYLKLSKSEIERREKNNEGIKFILRETTRGSAKNRYFFNVKRVLKKKPAMFTILGETVVRKYDYIATSCDQNQFTADNFT